MFKQLSKVFLSSIVAVLFLSSCGGGKPSVSDGGSITVNPRAVNYTSQISAGTPPPCTGTGFAYTAFVITVLNSNGVPVPDVGLSVTLDNSNATTSGGLAQSMILYDDPNWLGNSSVPPTNVVGASYSTSTGSDGTKRLIVGVDMSCATVGALYVSSVALFGQATLTVKAALP